jgi:hypothetical protein
MDATTNPVIQAELWVLEELETAHVRGFRPVDPHERSLGRYQMNVRGVLDAARYGLPRVPPAVREIWDEYAVSEPAGKAALLSKTWTWMKAHPSAVDQIAEEYYINVVRPQAGYSPALALMRWRNPRMSEEDRYDVGFSKEDLAKSFRNSETYLSHIVDKFDHNEYQSVTHATRARKLLSWLPAIERAGIEAAKRINATQKSIEMVPTAEAEALREGFPNIPDVVSGVKSLMQGETNATRQPVK